MDTNESAHTRSLARPMTTGCLLGVNTYLIELEWVHKACPPKSFNIFLLRTPELYYSFLDGSLRMTNSSRVCDEKNL